MKRLVLALILSFGFAAGAQAQDRYRAFGNPHSAYADNKYYTPPPIASKPVFDYSTPRYGGGYNHSDSLRVHEPFPPPFGGRYNYGSGSGSYNGYSTPRYGSGYSPSGYGR